jgi:hypothetical protein
VLLAGKDFVRLVRREAVSCSVKEYQQLSQQQLTFRLSLEDIRGLLGKYKKNISCFTGRLPSRGNIRKT